MRGAERHVKRHVRFLKAGEADRLLEELPEHLGLNGNFRSQLLTLRFRHDGIRAPLFDTGDTQLASTTLTFRTSDSRLPVDGGRPER